MGTPSPARRRSPPHQSGYGVDPIIATDADVAGQVAAQRDYWILTPQLLQPRYAALPPHGSDPAELVTTGSAPHLVDALDADQQLGLTTQVRDRLTAAAHAHRWETLASRIDPRLVADPHWRELASVLQDAHDQRLDVPAAITVALEEGPLELADPATDLADRMSRLTYPEPFAPDAAGHGRNPT